MSSAQDTMTAPVKPPARGPLLPPFTRRWEAADTVIALSGGLIITIFAVFAFLCVQGFSQAIETAKVRASTTADIVATQTSWLIGGGLTALRLVDAKLAFAPAVLDPTEKADLDAAFKALPTGGSLALYDANGLLLENGGSPSLPTDISGKGYFADVTRNGAEEIVAPQEADAATGAPVIVMARRLGGDVIAGVAVLAIPATALTDFWDSQGLTDDSTISIIRNDGFIVARHPALPETMNMAETSPFWADVAANESGTYDSGRSPADGKSRIVGYQHVPGTDVIAFGSIAREEVIDSLWRAIMTVLWLLVPIALALFGGSLLTARLLRHSARTQRTLSAAVAHNDVLFREIHHRVKNNLQSVASLLQMQPIPREIKTNMGQRIAAMSAVHEHIYRSDDFETVRVRDYLKTLINSLREVSDPRIQVTERLEELAVERDTATPIGLIVNEVVSNAFKHAFPDGHDGTIAVYLSRTEEGDGLLVIEDDGVGYDPEAPAKGIGRRLIRALTAQIGGESVVEAVPGSGSRFTLRFPLAQILAKG